jgi:hypothetical protein
VLLNQDGHDAICGLQQSLCDRALAGVAGTLFRLNFPPMIGDKGEYSVILVYDYDSRRFVANGAAEGESAARSGIEESL